MATYPTPQFDAITITPGGSVTGITASDVSAIPSSSQGAASGVATLDSNAHLVAAQFPALTGDITTTAGSTATALKAVGTAGTYGSASVIPVITTDAEGRVSNITLATAAGTVNSVALAAPSILTVTGSPVTSAGTLTLALASQSQNEVFASPNGAAGAPGFRSLVLGDLPAGVGELAASQTWTGSNTFQTLYISDAGSNGVSIKLTGNGATTPSKFLRVFNGEFNIVNNAYTADLLTLDDSGNLSVAGNVKNNIGQVAAYSGVAPSSLTIGASPWVWQNTNAYGVFVYFAGVTTTGTALYISQNNSTYYSVGDATVLSVYVPPGFYMKLAYTTLPGGCTLVPI